MGIDIGGFHPAKLTPETKATALHFRERIDPPSDVKPVQTDTYWKPEMRRAHLLEFCEGALRGDSWRGYPPIFEKAAIALGKGVHAVPFVDGKPQPTGHEGPDVEFLELRGNDPYCWTREQCEAAAKVQREILAASQELEDPQRADAELFAHFLENCGGFIWS